MQTLITSCRQVGALEILNRLLLACLALFYLGIAVAQPVYAAPLPESELQALDDYPSWVGACGSGINNEPLTPTVTGGSVYILGDSITNLAKPDYLSKFRAPDWTPIIEGLDSRHIASSPPAPSGLDQIDQDKDKISKATAIVIALGTNDYMGSSATIEANVKAAMGKIKRHNSDGAPVFWVNIYVNKHDAEANRTNRAIKAGVGSDGTIIDWYNEALDKADGDSFGDGVHPTKQEDIKLLVDLVHGSVAGVAPVDSTTTPVANVVCCPVDGGGNTIGSFAGGGVAAREKFVWDYLSSKNVLKPFQIAAIMGNMKVESASTFDPTIIQGGGHTNDPRPLTSKEQGYGIVQWTPGNKIIGLARDAGVTGKVYELKTQLDILWWQLDKGSEQQALKEVKATTTILDATWAFMGSSTANGGDGRFIGFERPGDQSESAAKKRTAGSKLMLVRYGGSSASTVSAPNGASTADVCCPPSTPSQPTTALASTEGTPAEWKQMYTGANKAKSEEMGRGKVVPKVLVIHYTQGELAGQALLDFFTTGSGQPYGIQFNIDRQGQVYQYFPLNDMQKTNHVGPANDKSIGVEITGKDSTDLLANEKQFQAVVALSKFLCEKYDIPCSQPKGDITGDGIEEAQGLLGHDETPGGGHIDPDATTAQVNGGNFSRTDSSKHPYMMKLRQALGYDPTPGKTGGSNSPITTGTVANTQCSGGGAGAALAGASGDGTAKDPVGTGVNRALALEAVKYDTKASNGKYVYKWGGLHGPVSQLQSFSQIGGGTDCTGFIRYVIWKVAGKDPGSFITEQIASNPNFKEIDPSFVAAGDIAYKFGHADFITQNKGAGLLHQFGAHSTKNDLYGGDIKANYYTKFYRYIGPGASSNEPASGGEAIKV